MPTLPNCYFVALHLQDKFGGVILYDNDHVIIKIGKLYYDKNGLYLKDTSRFLTMDMYGDNHIKSLL
jgi:hypothetical protein